MKPQLRHLLLAPGLGGIWQCRSHGLCAWSWTARGAYLTWFRMFMHSPLAATHVRPDPNRLIGN